MAATAQVAEWLQEHLRVEGISLSRKSQALVADGVGSEHLTKEQRTTMYDPELTMVRQGMRIVEYQLEHNTSGIPWRGSMESQPSLCGRSSRWRMAR